jgi:hypothetical protein
MSLEALNTTETSLPDESADVPGNEAETSITIDEAAARIDAILEREKDQADAERHLSEFNGTDFREGMEYLEDNEDAEIEPTPSRAENLDDVAVAVKVDGEDREVSISDLSDAYEKSHAIHAEIETFREQRNNLDRGFTNARNELEMLIPMLQSQLMGDFSDVQTPQDLQALAMYQPQRLAEFQQRQTALSQAQAQNQQLQEYNYDRFLDDEAGKLAQLLPELTEEGSGDQLRDEMRSYANTLGFTEDRLRQAGAAEISVLHKAMKYDRLQTAKKDTTKRARRARRVMRPGSDRPSDPRAGYKQAMTRLKKTGRVEDAARVIEHML